MFWSPQGMVIEFFQLSNIVATKFFSVATKGGHVICFWKVFDNFLKTYDTPPFLSDLKKNWSPLGNGDV
jgi:hypothetical protein